MSDLQPHEAVSFAKVFADELDQIRAAREVRLSDEERSRLSRDASGGLFGLAFSGGGIRSATFNLGVLQGLAGHGLLTKLDYLSTVSGGGYIGSWFISLLKKNGTPTQVQQVQQTISPQRLCHPEAPDQEPIEFLRQYSNYLTPRFSLTSADVWTALATWFRNFLLNFLLLISSISSVLLLPRLIGGLAGTRSGARDAVDAILTVIFFLITGLILCLNLRRIRKFGQKGVQIGIVVPLAVGTVFLARWLRHTPEFFAHSQFAHRQFLDSLRAPWIFFAAVYACIILFTGFWGCFREEHPLAPDAGVFERIAIQIRALLLLLLASIAPAFVVALLLWAIGGALKSWNTSQTPWCLLAWGPPALMLLLSLGMVLLIGLLGLEFDTRAREWLGRLRAWTLIYSISWMIVFAGALYGPLWIIQLINWHPWTGLGLSAGWVVTTLVGVLGGKSNSTSGNSGASGAANGGGNPVLDWITRIAPFIFMAGFILALSFAIHLVLTASLLVIPPHSSWFVEMQRQYFSLLSTSAAHAFSPTAGSLVTAPATLFLILLGIAILLGFRLDINVFSFHEFYKNRLVRCYLGAVRSRNRKPDPFTGFDQNDDQPLNNFRTGGTQPYYGPYPILNSTVNMSAGEKLAWQERKSAPFIFTPLYCGYNLEDGNQAMRLGESPIPAERRASAAVSHPHIAAFAYRSTDSACYPRGIHLGTAMAVSGAAASPNQGYHTSTAVAFLMTVFDVRLGWWVGNPRRDDTAARSSPLFNLATLSNELFGLSNARAGYVNLSDGGHFDNMGLYELIRRKCRYIIVSDAEQDGDLTFASLTSTLRNCRTDFGVEIKIALDRIQRRQQPGSVPYSGAHCVVGVINYPDDPQPGYLLYLKSSLTGDEAADVLGYHTTYAEFPHQSTADQWFTESQFEAYRKLGQHIVESAIGSIRSSPSDRAAFFRELYSLWYPPSEKVQKFSAQHAQRFTDLTLALSSQKDLAFLDPQIFTAWTPGPMDPPQRDAIYHCDALIGFMNTVYSDLDLENRQQREDPHNQGWLIIFEHWVVQPLFRETWEKTRDMYSERFRGFYEDLVAHAEKRPPQTNF